MILARAARFRAGGSRARSSRNVGMAGADSPPPGPQRRGLRRDSHRLSRKISNARRVWLLLADAAPSSAPGGSAREVELVAHWLHKGGIVLHFAGVDSISAAEELKGVMVAIPREERAELDADEAYIGDLVGCTLVDVAGARSRFRGRDRETWTGRPAPRRCWWCAARAAKCWFRSRRAYLRRIDLEREARGDGAAGRACGFEQSRRSVTAIRQCLRDRTTTRG